ncbi:hypothetical protein ACI2KR_08210 [Pseudomonas luteola]
METVKSSLWDIWEFKDGNVRMANGKNSFPESRQIADFIEKSETDTRYAECLHRLAMGNLIAINNKQYLLVEDDAYPGWSRPVSVQFLLDDRNMSIDGLLEYTRSVSDVFAEERYMSGDFLVNTRDPRYAISEWCVSPGEAYGPYEYIFIDKDGLHPISQFEEFSSSIRDAIAAFKDVRENHPDPLPPLEIGKTVLIDLPRGYTAEVETFTQYDQDYHYKVHEMKLKGPDGQVFHPCPIAINDLITLRDDPYELDKVNLYTLPMVDHVLSEFDKSPAIQPASVDELKKALADLKPNQTVKLKTADQAFELLLSYNYRKTYVDRTGHKVWSSNEPLPSAREMSNWKGDMLVERLEKAFTVHAKRTEGVIHNRATDFALNVEKLFALCNDETGMKGLIKESKSRQDNFDEMGFSERAISRLTGVTELEVLATSCEESYFEPYTMREIPKSNFISHMLKKSKESTNDFDIKF